MVSRLLVTHGHHFGVCYQLRGRTTLGRSSNCTIQLLDEKVSRVHASIRQEGDSYFASDEGSSNGTGLNGRLLLESTILKPGDEVAIGNNLLLFEPDLEIHQDLDGAGCVILASRGEATVPLPASTSPTHPGEPPTDKLLANLAEMLRGPRGIGNPAALVEAAAAGLDAERAALLLAPMGGEPLKVVATYPHRGRVTIARELIEAALQGQETELRMDGLIQLAVKSGRSLVETEAGTTLAIPLVLAGRTRGVFYAQSSNRSAFSLLPVEAIRSVVTLAFTHQLAEAPRSLRPRPKPPKIQSPIARSERMREVLEQAKAQLDGSAPLLIHGEQGTGKAFLARWIHRQGARSDGPFLALQCSGLPASSAETTLFGHERGVHPGEEDLHRGLLEQADGGTILLDAVGDLPVEVQTKLLRTLQEGRFYRLGGSRPVRVDIRLISGSHRKLDSLAEAGGFRSDLLGRMSDLTLELPPLRERVADVSPLAERFVHRFNLRNGLRLRGFSPEALQLLEAHDWPGNVRELRDTVEHVLVRAPGDRVEIADLKHELATARAGSDEASKGALARLEQQRVERALARCKGNKGRAAIMLRIPRGTLDRMLALHSGSSFSS